MLEYYIHTANTQSSLAELCDKDGNVIAEIMPKGTEVHRQAVIELLQGWIECAQTVKEYCNLWPCETW